jgi:mono/diheme cytochrome c family protein
MGKTLFIADCGKCHTIAAAGSQGTVGPNLDADKVPFTRVITAITEGVGGIQAEYTISTACTASPTAHKCLTFNQLHDIAKFVVTARKGGPGLIPYSAGSP